ncbi:MOSC domain-containing protein [Aeromicrobium duanguangcaii]|uniref:MOSC domain-containing protein n=1 Tax=Aeromicrobium duanguangcaii TaxID=2968086 RepID=A0ABY5KJR2_9ACTN|nr:MOSC N-terminal beta barrel domain-containing protein [Aeromicrobium duanguangcaii]MCD9154461.1 MOSC domain-containing protein [Aeromicrobium duanguangcaii]UUI70080.1 MOSC domain-containing protein [Aeromicrobium duanguangcaii]
MSLHRHPLKSGSIEDLDEATVDPWGLAGDRRWMVVDAEGTFLTAREERRLLTIDARLTGAGIRLSAPGRATLDVPDPDPAHQVPVRIWSSLITAAEATDATTWLTELLGRDVRLVHLDDPTRRAVNPARSEPDDRVSLADGYPLLVTTQTSLTALNQAIEADGGDPVPMSRFRPNLVIDGEAAWTEDDWRRIRVGDATFRAVKGCARCVITTLEAQDSGEVARGKEPIRTLARIRRFSGAVWFGVNLIPDVAGVTARVGDEVEVLEAAEPGGGPLGA